MHDNDDVSTGSKICPGCKEAIEKADTYCMHCGASQDRFMDSSEASTGMDEEEQSSFDHSVNAVTTLVADMERLGF